MDLSFHLLGGLCCAFGDGEGFIILDCVRRFTSRRGWPRLIICDNAPQFWLVKSTMDHQWLRVLQSNELSSFFSGEGVPAGRLLRVSCWFIVKQSLRKGIGCKLFLLLTLLAEIETIINTRPLTYAI